MCQLIGILNCQKNDQETQLLIDDTIKYMLAQASIGNTDGSGLALSYKDDPTVFTLKSEKSGASLAKNLELNTNKPFRHLIAHTRYSTGGAKTAINAHPHQSPSGWLLHNGWCTTLYLDVFTKLHHKQKEIDDKLTSMNLTNLESDCDSSALALVFNEDPKIMDSFLTGDEVMALLHIENTGKRVVLYTQLNSVFLAYSHKLGATLLATREFVLINALKRLGEAWPISEVKHDMCYYFDGTSITSKHYNWGENDRTAQESKYIDYKPKKHNWKQALSGLGNKRKVKKKRYAKDYDEYTDDGWYEDYKDEEDEEDGPMVRSYKYNPDTDSYDDEMDEDDEMDRRRRWLASDKQTYLDEGMETANARILNDMMKK